MTVRAMSSQHLDHYETTFIKQEPLSSANEGATEQLVSEAMVAMPMPTSVITNSFQGAGASKISTIRRRVNPSVKQTNHGNLQQPDIFADQVDSAIKEARRRFSQAKLERTYCCQIALLHSMTDLHANLAIPEFPREKKESSQAGCTRDEDEHVEMECFSSNESTAVDKAQSIDPTRRYQYTENVDERDKHCLQHHEQMQIWLKSLERKRTHLARKIAKRKAMTEEIQRHRLDVEGIKIEGIKIEWS